MKKLTTKILNDVIQQRPHNSYKGTFGKVLLIAGSANFGGAAIMAATATVYAGAGLVSVATSVDNFASLHARLPEAMVLDLNNYKQLLELLTSVNVIAIGPGLEVTTNNAQLLTAIIEKVSKQQCLIIDASAITLLAQYQIDLQHCQAQVILTPHQIEWQRLSGLTPQQQTTTNNYQYLQQIAAPQTALILKGSPSHIYFNNEAEIYENTLGTPAMATGGMGDTLTGMIAGFAAQFSNWHDAVLAAVFLHSYGAELLAKDNYVVLPTMIDQYLPQWMNQFAHAKDSSVNH
ncbi:NAD(P)H-hydrate dehydratase [Bombilactobacillus bombi]|uniref:ADP-dependent (S)-NAD(P)H-hydrate dehydratase n=1 Tax=Bombilactobacillus bombi TaxID=1303590 RepID=A0A417Z9K4_9LACO|nr:NAD(P)H-hydrate dehydratase [Bombilactobacillus bombi]RHW47339.1 NAD(P)H-hydrate dehydratase [Bombilactobacillus bombi]